MTRKWKILLPVGVAALVALAVFGVLAWRSYSAPLNRYLGELKSSSAAERRDAARALGQMGGETTEAIPALVAALNDTDKSVREAAKQALAQIGPPAAPALVAVLKDRDRIAGSDGRMGVSVREALAAIGPPAAPALIQALKDADFNLRWDLTSTLQDIGSPAIPALLEGLRNDDPSVRRGAAEALGKIGPKAEEVVPALIGTLKDADASVRQEAAYRLGEMGPAARAAIPALAEAQADRAFRMTAALALIRIDPTAKAAVPGLVDAVNCDSYQARLEAIAALGEVGPAAKDAVPALRDLAAAKDFSLRAGAALALGRIDPGEAAAAPALIEVMAAPYHDPKDYLAARSALTRMGPVAVPALSEVLKGDDRLAQSAAVDVLGDIGPAAKEAVPVLVAAVEGQYDPPLHPDSSLPPPDPQGQIRGMADRLAALRRREAANADFHARALRALERIDEEAARRVKDDEQRFQRR